MDNKKLTICAKLVDHSLEGARKAGLDIDRLLRKSNIRPNTITKPTGRIPVEKVVLLQRYCNAVMNDELSGMFEKPFRLGMFRQMALSAVHAGTLGNAFQRCVDFINLFENSFRLHLEHEGAQIRFSMTPIPEQATVASYGVDFMMIVLHRFISWLGNHRIVLNQVHLAFSPPNYRNEYQYTYYGAPVLFNQPEHSYSFSASYLEYPIVRHESVAENYARRAPLDMFFPLHAGGDMTNAVRNQLQDSFREGYECPSLQQIAEELGTHQQTLRRNLKTENSSYNTIKSEFRRDTAIHLLTNSQVKIEEIASKSGYSEPSAFIRAFKNWTGFTPLQFRKELEH